MRIFNWKETSIRGNNLFCIQIWVRLLRDMSQKWLVKGLYSRSKIQIRFWNKLPKAANNSSIDGIPMQINNSDLNQKCNIIMKGVFKLDNLKKFRPESALNVIFYWKVYNSQSSVVRRVAMPRAFKLDNL